MNPQEGDPSMTECSGEQLEFHGLGRRAVVGKFDGGMISSDGGGLLLGEVEARMHIVERLAQQFCDHRDPEAIEHTVKDLVGQRVFAQALGYEDLNDHDRLRLDPLLAVLVGKDDPTGQDRLFERDKGKALASSSTLNRLELTPPDADAKARYKKIVADPAGMDRLLVDCFLESYDTAPEEIWLDLDATDDPLHGHQERRFFHGYYGCYCYLPLYIFSGEHLLRARLRPPQHRCLGRQRAGAAAHRRPAVHTGPRPRSSSGATRASAARRSWPGASRTAFGSSWGWPRTIACWR
jgi:hypothetical protein